MKKYNDFRVCSVGRTLEVLGDKWIFLILREAFFGETHFDGFAKSLGIATNVLSDRLRWLVQNGVMKKEKDANDGRRACYRLTRKGLDIYAITLTLMQWGDRWLAGDDGPPLTLTHKTCGNTLTPVVCCEACGKPVLAREVSWQPGPGAKEKKRGEKIKE
ncbi:MAG: helix-turn-helix domain-containing protein [Thermodesulfobacteriota bacterium]